MRYGAVRRAERYIGLAVLAGVSSAAGAQTTQTAVFVSTGASVETNPYNSVNTSGESIAATAEIRPLMRWRSETTTLDLRGLAQFRQFVRRFGLEDNYGLDGEIFSRVSDRVTLRSNAGFAYNEGGFNDFARPGLLPGLPIIPTPGTPNLPDPTAIDVSVLGQRTRTKAFNIGAGASTQLNAYSSLSLDLSGRTNRFRQVGFGDFNTVSGQLSYSHQLSETTSAGLIGSLSHTDYRGTRVGDARTTSIMGSLDRRFGASWTLSGSAGLAITRSKQLAGMPDDKFDAFTAQLRFCNQGERSRFCVSGNRSPEPSANGNVRLNNTIQSDYTRRIAERETITLSGSYAHTGRGRGVAMTLPAVEFVSAAARYDNQIRNNLTFYTSTNYSQVYSSLAPRRANFGVNAGLQFRFGALQ